MSRFRAVLLAVVGLAVVAAAFVARRARQGGSPRASLQRLADGVRARDRLAIEQYLDVRRTAESVVDEARAAALAAGDSSSTDEGTKSLLVTAVEQSIWTTLLDPAATGRFHGITDVQQRGDMVLAGVRIRLNDVDSAALVHVRMERVAGEWRVVGVEGLGPYMRAGFERRRGLAYVAEMRSDLRNMMSAEEAYFAEHATYTTALAAFPYFSPTPGVTIEILEANRGGWRALARHQDATTECRVAVGASVPRGVVEGEPTCSRPRGR
jgi:hypothetical protein